MWFLLLWPGGVATMSVFYFMLTSKEKQVPDDTNFPMWLNRVIGVCTLAALPLMIPIFTVGGILLQVYRIKSRRVARMAVLGCVLSNDDTMYTFIVLSPPSYSGNSQRILLRTTNRSAAFIVCHDDRDIVYWIPSARSSMSIIRRIGRVELVQEIKGAMYIVDREDTLHEDTLREEPTSLTMIKTQLLFSLQRPVRYIQRAWRHRRDRRRQLAATVITSALLNYMYRPGGPGFGAARDRFENMSSVCVE
jgi:hypothetical protein